MTVSPSDALRHARQVLWQPEQLTGTDADTLAMATRSDLTDSALHAAQASIRETEF